MAKLKIIKTSPLEKEYLAVASIAENFTNELRRQISVLFDKEQITLGFPIQSRVKTWNSISEKLERVKLNIKNIKDLQDFVGLRIVLLFNRDAEKVCELIRNNFEVINEYDTQERLKEDQFGYSSKHFVIEVPDSWLQIPTFSACRGLKAEIQIRTIAQHMWAEVSHKLQYKQEQFIPPSIRRSIYRVSALLEIIDFEFERVLQERDNYKQEINVTDDNKEILNVDLLEQIMDSLLPKMNKKDGNENYSLVLKELFQSNITTVKDLKDLIKKYLDDVLISDRNRVKTEMNIYETTGEPRFGNIERILDGVFFSHTGLMRTMLDIAKKR